MTILFVVIWKLLKLFRPSVGRYNLNMEPKCSWSSYNYSNKVTLDIECFLCLSSFQKVKCKWENIYHNKHLQVGIVSPKHFKETFWCKKLIIPDSWDRRCCCVSNRQALFPELLTSRRIVFKIVLLTSPATYMWFLDVGDVVSSHGRPKLYRPTSEVPLPLSMVASHPSL